MDNVKALKLGMIACLSVLLYFIFCARGGLRDHLVPGTSKTHGGPAWLLCKLREVLSVVRGLARVTQLFVWLLMGNIVFMTVMS